MTDELASTIRYQEWLRRIIVHRLGFGDELWADPTTHPDLDEYKATARDRRPGDDFSDLRDSMTLRLIHDLVFAGGGVDAEYVRLDDALARRRNGRPGRCTPRRQNSVTRTSS